jgi:hypothetical protein
MASHKAFFDAIDPFENNAATDRPRTSGAMPYAVPFHFSALPEPPMYAEPQVYVEQSDYLDSMPHAVSTPDESAWPLKPVIAQPLESPRLELDLVPEEEESHITSRTSGSAASWKSSRELRFSQSVPQFRPPFEGPNTFDFGTAAISELPESESLVTIVPDDAIAPEDDESPGRRLSMIWPKPSHRDSWEDDIDYCYEHEAEADCEYDWDRASANGRPVSPTTKDVGIDERYSEVGSGRNSYLNEPGTGPSTFRASLLVPSAYDLPELSPMSISDSTSSLKSPIPQTPLGLQQPHMHRISRLHIRSPSSSSFKESDGFNLSPTFVIPSDYDHELSQEALYDEILNSNQPSKHLDPSSYIFRTDSEETVTSPIDHRSSTTSYRSSNNSFTHGSSSGISKCNSEESVLLSRAASVVVGHRSASSQGSLPDLIQPRRRTRDESDLTARLAALQTIQTDTSAPSAGLKVPWKEEPALSPVAESFVDPAFMLERAIERSAEIRREMALRREGEADMEIRRHLEEKKNKLLQRDQSSSVAPSAERHGRKVSAPVTNMSEQVRPGMGPRQRSASSAIQSGGVTAGGRGSVYIPRGPRRGSYMVFPATAQEYSMGENVI